MLGRHRSSKSTEENNVRVMHPIAHRATDAAIQGIDLRYVSLGLFQQPARGPALTLVSRALGPVHSPNTCLCSGFPSASRQSHLRQRRRLPGNKRLVQNTRNQHIPRHAGERRAHSNARRRVRLSAAEYRPRSSAGHRKSADFRAARWCQSRAIQSDPRSGAPSTATAHQGLGSTGSCVVLTAERI